MWSYGRTAMKAEKSEETDSSTLSSKSNSKGPRQLIHYKTMIKVLIMPLNNSSHLPPLHPYLIPLILLCLYLNPLSVF